MKKISLNILFLALLLTNHVAEAKDPVFLNFNFKLFGNVAKIEAGTFEKSILVNHDVRHYVLFVPNEISQLVKVPVIFFFHGNTDDPELYKRELNKMTILKTIAKEEKFLLAIPQGSLDGGTYGWQDGETSIGFFDKLLAELKNQYQINKNRIYATGMSSGAIMSLRLACERSFEIAAVVPVSGNFAVNDKVYPEILRCPLTDTPVAIRAYNGNEDQKVSYESALDHLTIWATEINGCAATGVIEDIDESLFSGQPSWEIKRWQGCSNEADIEFVTMLNRGHYWTDLASSGIWDFMKNHPKKCDGIRVYENYTCEDFYQQREGKSENYLKLCGYNQVNEYKRVLQISSAEEWNNFLRPCK